MWIRRELRVWRWTNVNSEFLVEYVVGILKSVNLRGSAGQAEEMLAEVLGKENAQIFLHELNAFMRSPFTSLQSFDNFVQYEVCYSLLGYLNSGLANQYLHSFLFQGRFDSILRNLGLEQLPLACSRLVISSPFHEWRKVSC